MTYQSYQGTCTSPNFLNDWSCRGWLDNSCNHREPKFKVDCTFILKNERLWTAPSSNCAVLVLCVVISTLSCGVEAINEPRSAYEPIIRSVELKVDAAGSDSLAVEHVAETDQVR